MPIILEFCKDGLTISDFDVEQFVNEIVKVAKPEIDKTIRISTGLVVHQLRLIASQGKIDPEAIVFLFKGEILRMNDRGQIHGPWPSGFADSNIRIMDGILAANYRAYQINKGHISANFSLISVEQIEERQLQMTGDNVMRKRCEAVRELVPSCDLRQAHTWVTEHFS